MNDAKPHRSDAALQDLYPRIERMRHELAAMVRAGGLPVGARRGAEMIVVEADGVSAQRAGEPPRALEQFGLADLALLFENGLRGSELAKARRAAAPPQWERLEPAVVKTLLAAIAAYESGPDRFSGSAPNSADEILGDLKAQARARGSLLGRTLRTSVADGYANYLITGVSDDQVQLRHLPLGDAYRVAMWRDDQTIERAMAEDQVRSQDAWEDIVASQNKRVRQP